MNSKLNDFEKFAVSRGIGSSKLNDYGKKNKVSPTVISESSYNMASIDIFSVLMKDRIIFLGNEIDEETANIITSQLLYLNSVDGTEPIKMFINSPGGSVYDGLAIYDTMNFIDPKIKTYSFGLSASMGAILLSSGAKGERRSMPNSRIMIHQVSSGIWGAPCSDVQINAKETKEIQTILYNILSENTGKSFEEIEKACDRDNWMSPKDALEFGIIDEIITKKK